jgi:hypothetical protein
MKHRATPALAVIVWMFVLPLLAQPDSRVPAISANVPEPFAKGYLGTLGGGFLVQSKSRLTGKNFDPDANALFTLGLGNPEKFAGLDVRANIYGLGGKAGGRSDFGRGSLDLHLSRKVTDWLWAGAGIYDLVAWRDSSPGITHSAYLGLTAAFPLRSGERTFNTLYVSTGLGNGRFRSGRNFDSGTEGNLNVFGSAAIQVVPEVNYLLEWSGYSLFTGVAFYPFKIIPGQILIGMDELTNEHRRFIIAGSVGFQSVSPTKSRFRNLTIPAPPPPQSSRQ